MGGQCLYCSTIISEYAIECPKCGASEPFNESKKRMREEQKIISRKRGLAREKVSKINVMTELEMKRLFPYTLTCIDSDCQKKLTVAGVGNYTCPHCGYPYNQVKCYCGGAAVSYDPIAKQFCCEYHLPVPCHNCYQFVVGKDKKIGEVEVGVTGGCNAHAIYGGVVFCPSCHYERFPNKYGLAKIMNWLFP